MKLKWSKKVSGMTALVMTASMISTFPINEAFAESKAPLFFAEAEDLTLGSGVTATDKVYNDTYEGFSGTGFAWVTSGGGISFEITLEEGAMYEVSTSAWMYLEGQARMETLEVDGNVQSSIYIPHESGWNDYSFGYFYLEAGKHTIKLDGANSWGYVLYDTVTFDYAEMPDYSSATSVCCDKNATPETQALMNYLHSQYGNHILSGQQEIYGGGNDGDSEKEFEYIYDNTGKYPAVRGYDFMNYNPLYGWEDGTTGRVIQWVAQRGGIATASWHINVPIDFENYELGDEVDWKNCTYKNYQSSNSTFNTENILTEGTKERAYFDLAVDNLAEQLLKLQDANAPLIFRPLHEAQGNYGRYGDGTSWFWWGDRGPEVYKKLWKLLYNKLTEEYGLHNLIWEINLYEMESSGEWYPGDEWVDLVAYDKYEGSPTKWGTDPATSLFLTLVDHTDNEKMVAMAENDIIPLTDGCVKEGAWWLYFCPWYGEYLMSSQYNTVDNLKEIYTSEYVVTMDELPSDLYGYERGNGGNWDVEGAYECEKGTLKKSDSEIVEYKYCSGDGYVFLKGEEETITQEITVEKAGTYYLIYGYQQQYEEAGKTENIAVNGKSVADVLFPFSVMFTECEPIAVELVAGKNTVTLTGMESWIWFDYLRVVSDITPSETTVTTKTTSKTTTTATTVKTLYGDVNCDGKITTSDLITFNLSLKDEVSLTEEAKTNADVDGDGEQTSLDIAKISKYLVGTLTYNELVPA